MSLASLGHYSDGGLSPRLLPHLTLLPQPPPVCGHSARTEALSSGGKAPCGGLSVLGAMSCYSPAKCHSRLLKLRDKVTKTPRKIPTWSHGFFPLCWAAPRAVFAPLYESLTKKEKDQSEALWARGFLRDVSVHECGCKCEILKMAGGDPR